jgi:hypothetical protein
VRRGDVVVWADEFTVSLHGRVVRVWAPVGEAVRQRLDLGWDCAVGALAVDPITGTLDWQWQSRGQKDRQARARQQQARQQLVRQQRDRDAGEEPPELAGWLERLAEAGVSAVVWDGAGSHRDHALRRYASEREIRLIEQPAASPELNPAERIIEVLRQATEGRVFESMENKLVEVEGELNKLALDPEGVRQLTRWDWLHRNILDLPP